ncbi:MAG: Ribosomal large subunit pseudouridine synthase D [Arcobacter lacus]|nr:MAG: Ribosomal large subunit pseudouridine synthase D [Arcobacter lacus]
MAKSTVFPMYVEGNKSKVKVVIETGRTHQIRVHLNYVGYPIIGDAVYGKAVKNVNRVLLHSKKTKIFDYEFEAKEPSEFTVYEFN